jgi:DNA-binding transcriptional LysR family regulator
MKIKDLSLWQAFYLTAEEKSFTKAAGKMKVGVPFLSKKIAALENELQTKLFQRTTRKLSLTTEGKGLLSPVSSLLETLQDLESKFEDKETLAGTIRFTCPVGIGHRLFPPLLAEFSNLHPNVKFDLDVSDRVIDIIEEEMDFAIRIEEPEGANFIFKKLAPNRHIFCASPRYLKENKPAIKTPADLHHHRILMLENYFDYHFKDRSFNLKDFARRQFITGVSGMFLTEMALNHSGVALRSTWDVNKYLKSGRLVQVLENYPVETFDIYIVISGRRFMTPRVRKFIDFLSKKAETWN